MSLKDFDPFRLDVAAFAKAAGHLEGTWPLADFGRLTETTVADASAAEPGVVAWSARGEARASGSGAPQVWLHLTAATRLALQCQRCLQPVEERLAVERRFMFVHGEDAAAQLDADSEDDVLALTRALDVRELVEDELLLALPIVPRHEVCPQPLAVPVAEEWVEDKPNPFAALASLKRSGPVN